MCRAAAPHTGPVNEPTQWYRDREADWETVFATLRAEDGLSTTPGLPRRCSWRVCCRVERPFFIRSRHDEVSLGIGGEDPCDAPAWEGRDVWDRF